MGKHTSLALSWIFHPVLMPVYSMAMLLLFQKTAAGLLPLKVKGMLLGLAVITTAVIPLLLIWVLYRLRLIASIYMNSREERLFPLLIMAIFYYLTYYLLRSIPVPMIFHMFMLGGTLVTILLMAINFFRKVSLHAAGTGSLTGLLAGMAFHDGINMALPVIGCLLVSGLACSARLKLNAHQPSDIYLGWLTGAAIMFVTGFLF